jgi:signal transduction histidine kinase
MTIDHLLQAVLLITQSIFLFATAGIALSRHGDREPLLRELVIYSLAAGLGNLLQVGGQVLSWLGYLSAADLLRLTLYTGLILAGTFLYLSQAFLRLEAGSRWWGLGGAWVLITLILESDVLRLGEGWAKLRPAAVVGAEVVGYGLFTGLIIWLLITAFRRTRQALHHNRILYWTLAYGGLLVGGLLVLARQPLLGNTLQLLAVPIVAYVALSYQLLDIRRMLQRIASYLAATLVVAFFYVGLFAIAESLNQRASGLEQWRTRAVLAFISALLLTPLAALGQRLAQRLLGRREYSPNQILGEYGLSISNILDLERLATVAIGLISEAMEITHGTLFVVDAQAGAEEDPAQGQYTLRGVRGLGLAAGPEGTLTAANPVTEYLRDERRPLTQYDIDLLPRFRSTPAAERQWLDSLGMDVYVPIYSKNAWIGLFGLGPKVSRTRYYDDDLSLLSILADHTAVALENARLVEGLQQLNQDLTKAYTELDQANHLLAQLDRTKTEFINIISHELGTPLMHLDSYNQLMKDDPVMRNSPDLRDMTQGMQKSITRMYEIVQTMLDLAKLDTKTLSLDWQPVQVLDPVRLVCEELKPALTRRRLALEIKNLRNLPAIEADRDSLRKIFHHVITNAIKYTPDGGKITINGLRVEAGARALAAEPQSDGIEVTVTDSGIGIDPRNLELIFLKFYQTGEVDLHSTDKTKFKGGGPGLGLTITRGLVEAHGGSVWAESPGCDEQSCPGSRFHIFLPLHRPPRPTDIFGSKIS